MRLGIMQPYFLPYIGYWQLINAVDKYIIYDDVNFIKGGWINRNRILFNGDSKLINVQLYKSSPNKLINEIEVMGNLSYNKKLLKTIENSYKKAPYFNQVFPLIENIINYEEKNLACYLTNSIINVCSYLMIDTELIISSDIQKNNDLRGEEKILEISNLLGAKEYYNAIGGKALYSYNRFRQNNIILKFLQTKDIKYHQLENEFIPNLSIIDVMMFNSVQEVRQILRCYELIGENS